MSDRAYHHGNLRMALLARAGSVIESDGVDGLSLRQLARDVGVSHGASARHFRDKHALLDALAVEGFGRLNAELAAAAAVDGPFSARFRAVGEAYVRFAVEQPALLGLMYRAKHHPDASAELVEGSGVVLGGYEERAVRAGEVVAYEPNERHGMRALAERLVVLAAIVPRPDAAR